MSGRRPKSDAKEALRSAIDDLRIAYRAQRIADGTMVSDISGTAIVTREMAHVVYLAAAWEQLTYRFAESEGGWNKILDLVESLAAYLTDHPHRGDPDAGLWPGRVQGGFGTGKSALDYSRQLDISSVYRHYFSPVAADLGLPGLKWHSLRHTYASIMAAAKVDIRKVSRWMGHSSISVTDAIYTHLFDVDHEEEMDKVDAYVAKAL